MGILIKFSEYEDFRAVAQERAIAFEYCYTDEGIVVLNHAEAAEDLLWAIQVLSESCAGVVQRREQLPGVARRLKCLIMIIPYLSLWWI